MFAVPLLLAGPQAGLGTRFQRDTPVDACLAGSTLVGVVGIRRIAKYRPVIFSQQEASPTNMLCLTAFPTPHDRMLRDSYCLRRPSRPRHPFSDHKVASRGSQMT